MNQKEVLNNVFGYSFKIKATLEKSRYGSDPEILSISGKIGEEITLQTLETWRGKTEPETFGSDVRLEVQDENLVLIHGEQVRILCGLKQVDSVRYNLTDEVWGECFPERIYSKKRLIEVDEAEGTVMLKCPECNNMFPEDMSKCSACGWIGQDPHGHCPECGGWATCKEWIPECECGWGEYNEGTYVVIVHWPDESVTIHKEFPTKKNMTLPVLEVCVMPKNEIILGVMERLRHSIYYRDVSEKGNTVIRVVDSLQDGEAFYNSEVTYLGKKTGSFRNWDSEGSWTVGDGYAYWLRFEENKIRIYRSRFSERDIEVPEGTEMFAEVCDIEDVVKMSFFTTSGWHGECYPIRTTTPKKGSQFKEDENWGTVFHRSTGSVTFTDFPLEIMVLRSEPDYIDYVRESEERALQYSESFGPEYYEEAMASCFSPNEPIVYFIEGSEEVVRQENNVWQHKHESHNYWHPAERMHK